MKIIVAQEVTVQLETCWRCSELGLPKNGIKIGERAISCRQSEDDGSDLTIDWTCIDCDNRMKDALSIA